MSQKDLQPLLLSLLLVACGSQPVVPQMTRVKVPTKVETFPEVIGSRVPETINTERGQLHVEREYIPGVVACEIGQRYWGVPAMEAQAIAARTYLARYLARTKGKRIIPIGPRFQCWKKTSNQTIISASVATAGQVVTYQGRLITGNYVSGTHRLTFDCMPQPPAVVGYQFDDWSAMLSHYRIERKRTRRTPFKGTAWTEIFVTRNEERRSVEVLPSPIAGSVRANRGALGQNAAVCLANNLGYETLDILKYFYGEDIALER